MSRAPKQTLDLSEARISSRWDKIIVHHTATKRQKKYDVEWCRALHKGKGWYDIGYHFYVEADGSISPGRNLMKVGAHCLGQNARAIGIAFVGGLDTKGKNAMTLTPTQERSVAVIIQELRNRTGKSLPVYSHNAFRDTFCPGFDASETDWEQVLNDGTRDSEQASSADQ